MNKALLAPPFVGLSFHAGWWAMAFFFCLSLLAALAWEQLGEEHGFRRENRWVVLVLTGVCLLLAMMSFVTTPEFRAWRTL